MHHHLFGKISVPGDKSISHRALMLTSLAKGNSVIKQLSHGQDVQSTLACMQALGVEINRNENEGTVTVHGTGKLSTPLKTLDCGNSGTTIRLLSGILAGANISATLIGDASLHKRPMKRIVSPLSEMGAQLSGQGETHLPPLTITASEVGIHGIDYSLPMASAQVKSAVLLAGLFTAPDDTVVVREKIGSRDHSERMLTSLGATVETLDGAVTLKGRVGDLRAQDILVPGDISSAAFWLVGAAILPGSQVTIQNVGLNPSRVGILDVLSQAGVAVSILNETTSAGEPYGDLLINGNTLKGDITITSEMVPGLVDEIPVLTILGLFTDGTFTLSGAEELRVKESDRLASMAHVLETLGVSVEVREDGYRFQGRSDFTLPEISTPFETHHDHRLVMALEILNLRAEKPLTVLGREWASTSYPAFFETLDTLLHSN